MVLAIFIKIGSLIGFDLKNNDSWTESPSKNIVAKVILF